MIAANFTSVLDWNKAVWGGIGLFVYVYFVNAWVSDDAFITFRTVENFIAGYGPNYNVGYRVQGYSHPLWFFLLSLFYFVFDGVGVDLNGNTLYYLTIGLSFLFSVGTVYFLVFFISKDKRMGAMGVVLLLMSKSFIDYTSSGLENPLSYFILTVYVYIYFSEDLKGLKKIFMLSLMAGLGAFTRLDHVLIYLPSLLLYLWQSKINLSNIKLFLAGWLPLIIWEIFSVIYYGLPFPNTAYAKLNHGLARPDLLLQGVFYYVNILFMDPIILFVLGYVIVRFLKNTRYLPLVLGMVLYLVYIIWIGGDFMSGRFFSLLYLLSVVLICKAGYIRTLDYVMIMIIGLGIGLSSYHPPLFSSSSYGLDETGNYDEEHLGRLDIFNIADERAYFYPNLGLLRVNYNFDLPPKLWKNSGWVYESERHEVEMVQFIGYTGYARGPNVHVLDVMALVDPLLAQLPIAEGEWRIGHFQRQLPEGYLESLETGENLIGNPYLKIYYDKLLVVVSGEIFKIDRFVEIWRINTGYYDDLIHNYVEESR